MFLVIFRKDEESSLAEGRPIDEVLTVECPPNADVEAFVAKYCRGWQLYQAFPKSNYDEF